MDHAHVSDVGCGISIGAVRRLSVSGKGLDGRALPVRLGRVTHIILAATGRLFFSPCRGGGTANSFVLVSPVAGGADTMNVVVSEIRSGSVRLTRSLPVLGLPGLNVTPRRCRTVRGTIGRLRHRNITMQVRHDASLWMLRFSLNVAKEGPWRVGVGVVVKLLRFGGLPVGALMNTS